jgi:phosphate uptake regulator
MHHELRTTIATRSNIGHLIIIYILIYIYRINQLKVESMTSEITSDRRDVRKLQVTGGSTYILSLPKRWVEEMTLEKGSIVTLEKQDDGSILMLSESSKTIERPSEAIILCESGEDPNLIIRKVVSAYLVGHNVIRVRGKDRLNFPLRTALKDFIRKKLVGTEVIADSPGEVELKVLLSYPELSVQSALRRMCVITSAMHRDAMRALKEGSTELAQEVIYMDDEVDRFSFYIIRQLKAAVEDSNILREVGLTTRRDCLGYRLITKSVERTADHAVDIANNTLLLKKPVELEVFESSEVMSDSAIGLFDEATETLYKKDFQFANEIVQRAKQVTLLRNGLMKSILNRADVSEVSSLSLIAESITRVAEYVSDIAEIILNLNIERNLPQ